MKTMSHSKLKQTWFFYTIYEDLMYSPTANVSQTMETQQQRDTELHEVLDKLGIGLFPKRTSIIYKLIPTFKCLTAERKYDKLNILLINKENSHTFVVLKRGKQFNASSEDEALKIMYGKDELPEFSQLEKYKVAYNFT